MKSTLSATGVDYARLITGIRIALFAVANSAAAQSAVKPMILTDGERGRQVPVQLHFPTTDHACMQQKSCPVALLSPGYGVPHTSYSFIANTLAEQGHLVVAVQHDLPSDPPLRSNGDLVTARTPAWQKGAANLRFVKSELARVYPDYDWSTLILIGHSNGGDISSLLLRDAPDFAAGLITLDHRRVPLPRDHSLQILSIRGSDFEADPGVLPSETKPPETGPCIVKIADSRHNDMRDEGPAALKSQINALIRHFLQAGICGV